MVVMQALRVHQNGEPLQVLQLESVSEPVAGEGQLGIRVHAAALNFADGMLAKGIYQLKPDLPFTPGMEVAGEIVEIGPQTQTSLRVGDRVMAVPELPDGGLAQHCLAAAVNCYEIPDDVDYSVAAATLIPFQTSYIALSRRGQLAAGENLLVHAGAGGVGSAAIQLGVAMGARVIATAGSDQKCQICLDLGAEAAINYRASDFVEEVKQLTAGKGADVIYDPVGGDTFDRSRKCIAWEGRILVVGFASGDIPKAPANHALFRNYSVVGVYMGGYPHFAFDYLREVNDQLWRWYQQGKIKPLIGQKIGLHEAAEAIADLGDRKTVGKVIVLLE
jgi:NADPH2:quinone reductase